jgi:hypothetical protein
MLTQQLLLIQQSRSCSNSTDTTQLLHVQASALCHAATLERLYFALPINCPTMATTCTQ